MVRNGLKASYGYLLRSILELENFSCQKQKIFVNFVCSNGIFQISPGGYTSILHPNSVLHRCNEILEICYKSDHDVGIDNIH